MRAPAASTAGTIALSNRTGTPDANGDVTLSLTAEETLVGASLIGCLLKIVL